MTLIETLLRLANAKLDLVLAQQDAAGQNLEKVMATQAEAAAQLTGLKDLLTKIGGESTALLAKIDALTAAAANAPVTPELQAAIDGVVVQAKKVDDMVPDLPVT